MQEVHFEPFYRRYIYFGGRCGRNSRRVMSNHSGIYRSSHVTS